MIDLNKMIFTSYEEWVYYTHYKIEQDNSVDIFQIWRGLKSFVIAVDLENGSTGSVLKNIDMNDTEARVIAYAKAKGLKVYNKKDFQPIKKSLTSIKKGEKWLDPSLPNRLYTCTDVLVNQKNELYIYFLCESIYGKVEGYYKNFDDSKEFVIVNSGN